MFTAVGITIPSGLYEWSFIGNTIDEAVTVKRLIAVSDKWNELSADIPINSMIGPNTDAYGFSALPGGGYYGAWDGKGNIGEYWTAGDLPPSRTIYSIRIYSSAINKIFGWGDGLYSVRCVKGEPAKCGGSKYDPFKQFCYNKEKIYSKCGGNDYDPSTHSCLGATTYEHKFCNGKTYNPATHFCAKPSNEDPKIVELCKGNEYNTETKFCNKDGELLDIPKFELSTFIDERDTTEYKATKIGTQTWMAENLNFKVEGSLCYNNDPENCKTYGRLYEWQTAMKISGCSNKLCEGIGEKHQGICPSGWHIPSDGEWDVLAMFINPECEAQKNCANAGGKLKATSGWKNNKNGTNEYGFSVLQSGCAYKLGSNTYFDNGEAYFWSSSERPGFPSQVISRYISANDMFSWSGYDPKTEQWFSIRCLKD